MRQDFTMHPRSTCGLTVYSQPTPAFYGFVTMPQGLSTQPWLTWYSLYRPDWPQMQNSSYLCLQSAVIGVSLQVISPGSSQGPSNGLCHHLPPSPTATKNRLQIKTAHHPNFLCSCVAPWLCSCLSTSMPSLGSPTHTPLYQSCCMA